MAIDQNLFYLPAIPNKYYQQIPEQYTLANNITIPAGKYITALQHSYLNKAGFIRVAYASFNSPYASIKIVYDGKEIVGNIYELYTAGFTEPQPGIPYVTRYDTTNGNYVVAWQAERSFANSISMFFGNASPTYNKPITITVLEFIADVYVWNTGFYEALAAVKRGETLTNYSSP